MHSLRLQKSVTKNLGGERFMTKKCISWVISLLVLVSCFAMPIGTVQAETVAKDFTFSANFDNLDDLAAGEIDEAVFAEKTGLTITKSALSRWCSASLWQY